MKHGESRQTMPRSEQRRLWIEGTAGRLEAAFRAACPARGSAIFAHPHPLHGGTLHNPVVFHAERELHRSGFTTLRFNFRGVGESDGAHDEGRGETKDVAAAVSWLRGVAPELPLILVGYSFGSWCGIRHAVDDPNVAAFIAIGFPVEKYDFPEVDRFRRPMAVVQGSDDEFGSPEQVRRVVANAAPPATVHEIPDAPHLFPGRAPEVATKVVEAADLILMKL
jgi:alpha/beta superfamily hydrolase